jgi:hypothetical protein
MTTAEYMRIWRKNNPEKCRIIKNRARKKHVEHYRKKAREYYANNKDKYKSRYLSSIRNAHLKFKYGITEKDYKILFKKQKGLCAICGMKSKKRLNVDHCHSKNVIRGLLCWKCNTLLGNANDDTEILLNAIKYLKGVTKK